VNSIELEALTILNFCRPVMPTWVSCSYEAYWRWT